MASNTASSGLVSGSAIVQGLTKAMKRSMEEFWPKSASCKRVKFESQMDSSIKIVSDYVKNCAQDDEKRADMTLNQIFNIKIAFDEGQANVAPCILNTRNYKTVEASISRDCVFFLAEVVRMPELEAYAAHKCDQRMLLKKWVDLFARFPPEAAAAPSTLVQHYLKAMRDAAVLRAPKDKLRECALNIERLVKDFMNCMPNLEQRYKNSQLRASLLEDSVQQIVGSCIAKLERLLDMHEKALRALLAVPGCDRERMEGLVKRTRKSVASSLDNHSAGLGFKVFKDLHSNLGWLSKHHEYSAYIEVGNGFLVMLRRLKSKVNDSI